MFESLFNDENMSPVLDMIKYNEHLVVSLADKTLHVFKDFKNVLTREFSNVIVKMVHQCGKLILGTYNGTIYVLNHEFRIEDIVFSVTSITSMSAANDILVIGSYDKMVVLLRYISESSESGSYIETLCNKNNNKHRNNSNTDQLQKKRSVDYMTSIMEGTDNVEYIKYPDFKYSIEEKSGLKVEKSIEDERMHTENQEMTMFKNERRKTLCLLKPYKILMKEMAFMSKIWKRRRYRVDDVQLTKKVVTSVYTDGEYIGMASEDMVGVYNLDFQPIWQRNVECNVNCILVSNNYIYIGLINGKILCEEFRNGREKYGFNAHFQRSETEKVYHSVNYICLGMHLLYSCGTDGNILGWDLKGKKQSAVSYETIGSIRKFLIDDEYIYIIVEDIEEDIKEEIKEDTEEETEEEFKKSRLIYKKLN